MKKRILSMLLALSLLVSLAAAGAPALAADETEINIFGIGDFGGALDDSGTPAGNPGGARIVGAMKELTANAANPIVVAGGTSYTGNAISEVNHGTSVNDMYRAMGVQYVNIGNHDFDWSTADNRAECFATWEEEGGFTFLNANVRDSGTQERIFTPYAVQEVDGVKIGFFGVIGEGNYGNISSFNTEGIEFTAALDESLEVVRTLREEEGCDVIVAMPHIASAQAKPDVEVAVGEGDLTAYIAGLNDACEAAGVKGIDAAFASQCTTAHCAVVDGVPLVKAMNYGKIIAQLSIVVDGDDVTVTPSLHPLTQITVTEGEEKVSVLGSDETTRENTPEDAEFKAVYDTYNAALTELMDAPRGTADAGFSYAEGADRFAYQKWYLRANLYYINEVYGEPTVAYFQNTGGIRNIGDTVIQEGDPIALRLLYTVAPFDNYIVTMDMTGKDIKALLSGESQYGTYASLMQYGLDVTYASGEYEANGEVVSVKLNGEELADDEVYHIACNTFLYPGPGDNMDFSAGTNAKNINVINRNAVLEALLHRSAALKDVNDGDTLWVSHDTASYVPETYDPQASVEGEAALNVGANRVTFTVTSPYENPYTTPGTVSGTYTLNVVREYADQAEIPAEVLEAVKALTAVGVFNGNGDGCFAAEEALSVKQLAVLLARAAGAELEADPASWAGPALAWCAENGVELPESGGVTPEVFEAAVTALFGECGGEFSQAVTRGEAAAALAPLVAGGGDSQPDGQPAVTAPSLEEIDKYGDIRLSITAGELAALGFEHADYATVRFLDQELTLPVIPEYRYVGAKAAAVVMWTDESRPVELEVFNGSFAETYGLAKKVVEEDGSWHYEAFEGVEFPVEITISLAEKGGYADTYAIFDLVRTNERDDYPDLTDEEFANFRAVATTGMGENKLYRSSSPANPSIGRNTYADSAAKAAGVKSFVNLADSETSANAYDGYADSYYSQQNVKFLNLGVDFTTELNREGVAEAMRFIATAPTPILIHCNEGQDRAGFVSALLECLMGASFEEVEADYMKTFTNYYGVEPGTDQYEQIANNIAKNLKTAFQVEDITSADLAAECEAYLLELGVTEEEIAAVRTNLG